jgi:hypothetical protein
MIVLILFVIDINFGLLDLKKMIRAIDCFVLAFYFYVLKN